MSSLNPDQATAARLAGLAQAPDAPRAWDPATGDGSLVEDPAVRAPLVLGNRSFNWVTETVCGYAEKVGQNHLPGPFSA